MKSKPPPVEIGRAAPVPTSHGKVITLYSPKGGVGRTTLAVNLAIALYSEETPVVIIDGNLQFGDIPVSFNVQSKNTILDLASRATELDPDIVEEVLIAHSTGIKLLAPTKPELAESVSGEEFRAVLEYLRKQFTYVIVDGSPDLTEITLAALDASDLVLLVTTQEIPTLADLSKFMDLAPMLKLDRQKTLLTLSQYDRRINITPEKVSQYFRQEVAAVVPSDPRVVLPSINRGIPFMLEQEARARPVGQAIVFLAKLVRKRLKELADQAEKDALMAIASGKLSKKG
jgi:pilus assembly protein CpaE